ncbi:hypothetical protein [Streptomyces cavernicola]|uniref:FUSC family protein n=1 Tax=Streptomyces cavernicola TaxID=3043613 RepID=A0ABT6S8K5_9ACTN|nr:hypothetical protein [Streptomyces sp. B-S-A6]MDI3404431.1 hypothetical protein [Streptomyces sp. B-S-A6]
MSTHFSNDTLELFLSRARIFPALAVPAYLAFLGFLVSEEGWRWSFLALIALPPVAAVLGHVAKRDIRAGLGAAAIALALAPLLVVGAVEAL